MHLRLILVLAFFSISFVARSEGNPDLDKLLEEVKAARLNSVKADLPDGIYWLEGYYSSGLFYLCSNSNGLHLRDGKNKLPDSADISVYHVEFTADLSAGAISINEVHSVSTEHPNHCVYAGKLKNAT